MGSRMWSEVMRGPQERYVDPYGLYRQWFESAGRMREQMTQMTGDAEAAAGAADGREVAGGMNPQEMWGKWVETTLEGWQRAAGLGTEMMSMTPHWMRMMGQARENLLAQQKLPNDPLELAVQWYNATSGPVSEFVQDVIEREEFLDVSSRFLQNYASLYKVFGRNSEEYLHNLQMPARSDVTRVASLVVALEDKVDRLEETFEEFEYGYQEPATAESIGALEGRLDRLDALEGRMDRIEGKLDQLLSAVEDISANGSGETSAVEEPAQQEETAIRKKSPPRRQKPPTRPGAKPESWA